MTAPPIADTLHRAWPHLAADPAATEEYVRALADLDPASVEAVVSGIVAQGAQPPRPGLLRVAILARTGPPATGPSMPAPPGPSRVPAAPTRHRPLRGDRRMVPVRALLLTAGLAGLFAGAATQHPWAVIRFGERAVPVAHDDIRGGLLMGASARLTVVILLLSVLFMFLRNRDRNLRQAFAAFTVLHGLASSFTVLALLDVRGTAVDAPSAGTAVDVATTGWIWQALLLSLLGAAVGAVGWRHVRRNPVPDRSRNVGPAAPPPAAAVPPPPVPRAPASA